MASVKVLLRTSKLKGGVAPLYLRIIKHRKAQFVSLGISVKPQEWNEGASRVKKSHPKSSYINNFIAHKVAEAESVALELETKSKSISAIKIKDKLLGKAPEEFFAFAQKHIQRLEGSGNIGTYKRFKSVIEKLRTYTGKEKLFLDEITVSFLKDYGHHLRTVKKNSINTVHANFRVIRRLFNDAVDEGLAERNSNPFYVFKMKTEKTTREYLTEEELQELEKLKLKIGERLFHHRNLYVFSAYVGGLRISDALQLKWTNFDGERINLRTQKTGGTVSIRVPDKGLKILEAYKPGSKTDSYIFPILKKSFAENEKAALYNAISSATAYINKDLKTLAEMACISKSISFHTSRHTWATRALRKGMRIEYVSKLMGHGAIKETQIYAKIVNEELDKAMDVFNK